MKGKIKPGTDFITRSAPGLGGNAGGAIEVVTPSYGATIIYTYVIGE